MFHNTLIFASQTMFFCMIWSPERKCINIDALDNFNAKIHCGHRNVALFFCCIVSRFGEMKQKNMCVIYKRMYDNTKNMYDNTKRQKNA